MFFGFVKPVISGPSTNWKGKGREREGETKYHPSTIVEADRNILRIGAELLGLNVDVMEESLWYNYGVLVFSFSGFPI